MGRDLRFARWLKAARVARFPRERDALAAFAAEGLYISASEYAQWESGSRLPREDNPKREALYRFFGGREEEAEPTETPDLAGAIHELAVELRAQRTEAERIRALEDTVAELLRKTLTSPEGEVSRTPRAREQSKE